MSEEFQHYKLPKDLRVHEKVAHNSSRLDRAEDYIEDHKYWFGVGALVIVGIIVFMMMSRKGKAGSKK